MLKARSEYFSYFRYLITASSLISLIYFIEIKFNKNQGSILLTLNIIFLLMTAFKERKVYPQLSHARSLSLIFFAIADLLWMATFYIFHFDSKNPGILIPIALSYGLGFLFALSVSFQLIGEKFSQILKIPLLWFLLCVGLSVEFRFLILPYLSKLFQVGSDLSVLTEIFAILTSLGFFVFGILYVLMCPILGWTVSFTGTLALVFADWAMRAEKLIGTTVQFGPYELYWSFGVILTCAPVWLGIPKPVKSQKWEIAKNSLLYKYKTTTTAFMLSAILLVAIFTQQSFSTVQIVSVASGVGIFIATFFAFIAVREVIQAGQALSDLSRQQFFDSEIARINLKEVLEKIPSELRDLYENTLKTRLTQFRTEIEAQAESRKIKRYAELASQVAHDIRSPLAALTMAEKDLAELPEKFASWFEAQ